MRGEGDERKGKRRKADAHTDDHPSLLPLKPLTARLTTLIHTSPEMAALEQVDMIRCTARKVLPREPRPRHGGEDVVEFGRAEGLVRFEGEVESWECR